MGYRIVRMSRELFEQMFCEGWCVPNKTGERVVCTKGLPEGAKLEAVSMDRYFDFGVVALKFSHPMWPDLPPDHVIPEIVCEYSVECGSNPFVEAARQISESGVKVASPEEEQRRYDALGGRPCTQEESDKLRQDIDYHLASIPSQVVVDGPSPLAEAARQLFVLEAIDEARWKAFQNGLPREQRGKVTIPPKGVMFSAENAREMDFVCCECKPRQAIDNYGSMVMVNKPGWVLDEMTNSGPVYKKCPKCNIGSVVGEG